MYQVRPEPPASSEPSSATIASSWKVQRIAETIAVSDSRSASETRSVWLDFASTPVGFPSKVAIRCLPAARAASVATAIGSGISALSREPAFDFGAHGGVRGDVPRHDVDLAVPVDHVRPLRESGVSAAAEEEVIDRRDVVRPCWDQRRAVDEDALHAIRRSAVEMERHDDAGHVQPAAHTDRAVDDRGELSARQIDGDHGVRERERLIKLTVRELTRGERGADAGHVVEGNLRRPSLLPPVVDERVGDQIAEGRLLADVAELLRGPTDGPRRVFIAVGATLLDELRDLDRQ